MIGPVASGAEDAAGRGAGPSPGALAPRPFATPEAQRMRALARPASFVEAPHRLLLEEGRGGDSAWLRIEGGRFAGTEIHLRLTGRHVEVCVLTPHEASRQTLAIAMEAVRNRLRARGLTMIESGASGENDPRPPWRRGTGGARRAAATGSDSEHANDR